MAGDRGLEEALAIFRLFGEHGALWITQIILESSNAGSTAAVEKYTKIAAIYRSVMNAADAAVMCDSCV
jgi:hypothetical protein